MANAKITDHVDSVTSDYFYDNLQQMVWDAPVGLRLFMEKATKKYHGGSDSQYPYVTTTGYTNFYDNMTDGTVQAIVAPSSTDITDAAHQEGWAFWYDYESYSQEELSANVGNWASGERAVSLSKAKVDFLHDRIGYMFDQNIANGTAANNDATGLVKLFDITNANYMGWAFNGADAALRPANTTIATDYTSLVMADLFEAYGDIEDKGRFADTILIHPDVKKKLRTLTENTVDRSQGGNAKIGHLDFDVLSASVVSWRLMPTTTSTKIYFMNFGQHAPIGIKGTGTSRKVPEGKNFQIEFAGPKPHGMTLHGWTDMTPIGHPGVFRMGAYGAFKIMCNKPKDQAYISIA